MASKTVSLRRSLGQLKSRLRDDIQSTKDLVNQPIPQDIGELSACYDDLEVGSSNLEISLDKYVSKYEEWTEKVDAIEDEATQEAESKIYDGSVDEHHQLTQEADKVLVLVKQRFRKLNERQAQLEVDNHSVNTSRNGTEHKSYSVKPPRLSLPTFKGDYLEWEQFWGIYETNIHEREDMNDTEKFTCLLSHLDGPAKQVVGGIRVTNSNYAIAVDLLKDRFDRASTRLIPMLYSELQKMPPCDKRIANKMKTFDDCERIFRQLEAAGEDVKQTRANTGTLLSKFPVGMIHDLQLHFEVDANSRLGEARDALKGLLKRQETTFALVEDVQSLRNLSSSEQGKGKGYPSKGFDQSYPEKSIENHDSAFAAVANGQNRKPWFSGKSEWRPTTKGVPMDAPSSACYFCGGNHFNGDCTTYPTATTRRQRLQQLNRCGRCTRLHQGNCRANIRCVHCRTDNQHCSALCLRKFPDQMLEYVPQEAQVQVTPVHTTAFGMQGVTGGSTSMPITSTAQSMIPTAQMTTVAPANTMATATLASMTGQGQSRPKTALFQTAKTTVFNPTTGHCCILRLVMDTLSSRSYIRESAARNLGLLGGKKDNLYVTVFGTNKQVSIPTQQVSFDIMLQNGTKLELIASTTKVLCASRVLPQGWTDLERTILQENLSNLADDPFDEDPSVDILIGADYVWEFMLGERIKTQSPSMFFVPSGLGLMLAGTTDKEDETAFASTSLLTMLCITETTSNFPAELGLAATTESVYEKAYPDITEYWDLEKLGITDDPIINEDDVAFDKFQQTITFENGRYQVQLPWIEEKRAVLPPNYDMAYDRFRSLCKRLQKSPEILQSYRDILKLQRERGIIEKVPFDEIETSNALHYLPHHPVIKPTRATTKVRVVFDASAKCNRDSVSLNECLYRGPVILPDLCHLLMRVRTYQTVVISDIEKAFLQVGLQSTERDVTRFLWFKDDNNLSLKDNVEVWRYCRVNFGVICSPFLLAATLDYHLSRENNEFAEKLRKEIYVDNVISGFNANEDHIKYYDDLKALFDRAGMNIQQFCSNSSLFMASIPEVDRVKSTDVRLLGVKWDSANDDSFRLFPSPKIRDAINAEPVTKRLILQAVASIFDPLGWFQPALFPAKMLLQRLWSQNLGWDDPVTGSLRTEWEALRTSFSKIFDYRLDRFIGPISSGGNTLAVFSDASAKGYAAVVYLRVREEQGIWKSRILYAKSRLTPSSRKTKSGAKTINLPRLELLGAVIAARAAVFCRNALSQTEMAIDFFIDSQCVLHWLRKRGYLKRFVAGRVEEIQKVTNCTYHYVSSAENPADYSTRGMLTEDLLKCEQWWNGPTWLSSDRDKWPVTNMKSVTDTELQEIQAELKPVHQVLVATEDPAPIVQSGFLTLNPGNSSSLQRLVRTSAVCVKFLKLRLWNKLSATTQDRYPALQTFFRKFTVSPSIEAEEYNTIEMKLVKTVQQNHFADVLDSLEDKTKKQAPIVGQLGLSLDSNGMIRAEGRFEHADLPEATRVPLLLPRRDPLVSLIISDVHLRTMHGGVSHTLSRIREKYWIVHGRAAVRAHLGKCLVCRRYKSGKPFKLPPMPPWPRERVCRAAPFQFVGLDYFGPINVLVNDNTAKMWSCLFTCLVTRAIHLEPVSDCSAQEFLNGLIRFVSRRGAPDQIISDNAGQFRLTQILGDQAWKRLPIDESVTSYASANGIAWKFITELAPWQGGFYERLVGLVKNALKTTIKRRLLRWTDFVTLLTETEAVVNSRPITYVHDDISSNLRVLRPCDFLLDRPTALSDSPDGEEVRSRTFGEAGKFLAAQWKRRCRALERLWKIWYEDYLSSLRERYQVQHRAGRGAVSQSPSIGQIVLVSNFDAPRGRWKTARIIGLTQSADNRIRSAEILLPNGIKLRRPINHLIPLEVEQASDEQDQADQQAQIDDDKDPDPRPAPDPDTLTSNDDDDFWGFSQADIQRTVNALKRYDDMTGDSHQSENDSA